MYNPAKTNYIFVANGEGVRNLQTNLKDHNKNVEFSEKSNV